MSTAFPCTRCGLCCRHLLGGTLDRGDGVCRHLDEASDLCGIYEERPEICNVDLFYDRNLTDIMNRTAFHYINTAHCLALMAAHGAEITEG